jgi:hypothetical protein
MPRIIFLIFLWALLMAFPTRAVEMNGGYDTNAPTSAGIPNWNTGWPAGSVSGWDYVGEIGGASGVYVGNGWVLTAGHVGEGTFTLPNGPGAGTYQPSGTPHFITDENGTADLCLFQITPTPNLPPLTIGTNPPVAFLPPQAGTSVAMFGFGGDAGHLTWGVDTVTEINELVTPSGNTYVSDDYFCDNGTVTRNSSSITNSSTLISGDSGGANFTYNATTGIWELEGINEVTGSYSGVSGNPYYGNGTFSGMVQLNTYAPQINALVFAQAVADTPTLPFPGLIILAILLCLSASSWLRKEEPQVQC